jgi:hypothetical protein
MSAMNKKAIEKFKKTIENKTRNKVLDKIESIKFIFISFSDNFAKYDGNITYQCNRGHIETRNVRNFMSKPRCTMCSKIYLSTFQSGSKGNNWQGGLTNLNRYLKHHIVQWKKDSMEACNYKCVITGKRFDQIHHLYSFNNIVYDAILELGLEKTEFIGDYSEDELMPIIQKVQEIHYRYPLGVCLTKKIHKLFHKLYGMETIPKDFYEFQSGIKSGEIKI